MKMVKQKTVSHQYGNFMGDQKGEKAMRMRQIIEKIPSNRALVKSLDFMSFLFVNKPLASSSLICESI